MSILSFLHHGTLSEWADDEYHYTELTHYTDLFNVAMEQQLYALAALVVKTVDRPAYRTHCDRDLEPDMIIGKLYGNREDPDKARDLTKRYRETVLRKQALNIIAAFGKGDFESNEKRYPGFLLDFTEGLRENLFGKGWGGVPQ